MLHYTKDSQIALQKAWTGLNSHQPSTKKKFQNVPSLTILDVTHFSSIRLDYNRALIDLYADSHEKKNKMYPRIKTTARYAVCAFIPAFVQETEHDRGRGGGEETSSQPAWLQVANV